MRNFFLISLFAFISLLQPISCATGSNKPPALNTGEAEIQVPPWVRITPKYKDRICAVGTCEPTFYPEEGKPCAADNARAELVKTISVDVKSIMVEEVKNDRQNIEEVTVSQVSSWVSESVLNESVVEKYWYDKEGVVSPRKKITYALVCMPKIK